MTITNLAVVRAGGVPSANAVAAPYGPAGPAIAGTSYSIVPVDDEGSKTFVLNEYGLSLQPGVRMRASATGTGSWLEGTVTAYNASTRALTIFADLSSGDTATYSSWTLNVAGEPGSVPDSPTFKNLAGRNGGFEVWQRGSTNPFAASTTAYSCDGWYLTTGANQASVVSRQPGIANGSLYCARVQRNAGQIGSAVMVFAMPLDSDELVKARGRALQLFFTIRAGANWSPGSGHLGYRVCFGTGSPAKRGATAYLGETTPFGLDNIVALSPGMPPTQVVVGPSTGVGTNVTQAEIQFYWTPGDLAAGADDWFEIDDVDLRVVTGANIATMFERSDFIFDFQRCQRHFEKSYPYDIYPGVAGQASQIYIYGGASISNATYYASFPFSQRKRVSPSMQVWSFGGLLSRSTPANFGADFPANSAIAGAATENSCTIFNNSGGALTPTTGGTSFNWVADAGI